MLAGLSHNNENTGYIFLNTFSTATSVISNITGINITTTATLPLLR